MGWGKVSKTFRSAGWVSRAKAETNKKLASHWAWWPGRPRRPVTHCDEQGKAPSNHPPLDPVRRGSADDSREPCAPASPDVHTRCDSFDGCLAQPSSALAVPAAARAAWRAGQRPGSGRPPRHPAGHGQWGHQISSSWWARPGRAEQGRAGRAQLSGGSVIGLLSHLLHPLPLRPHRCHPHGAG